MDVRLVRGRWVPLALALVVLVGLGGFGLSMVSSANRAAEEALGQGALARQRTVSLLTDQYLRLAAGRLLEVDQDPPLTLEPGATDDVARLQELIDEPGGFFDHGAAITDLLGRPLTRVGSLPPATDEGYVPLRAALLRGEAGVSSVMTDDEDAPVVAVAVPLLRDDAPAAVLVAVFRAAVGPLQQYSQHLATGTEASGMVLDGRGTIVAARDVALVGTRWGDDDARAVLRSAPSGHARVERYGIERALTWAPIDTGGWTLLEEASAAAFYASANDQSTVFRIVLLALLVTAGLGTVLLDHRTDRARRRGAQRAEALVRDAHDVITIVREGTVTYASPAARIVLGVAPEELVGTHAIELVHPDDRTRVEAAVTAAAGSTTGRQRLEARVRRADGTHSPCEVVVSDRGDDPTIRGTIVSLRDITEVAALHARLSHQASHDALTGLANRTHLERRLAELVNGCDDDHAVAVLFLDLDGFKEVNDDYGHEVGDRVLAEVAQRLRGCVREGDLVARLGGDEFIVACRGRQPAQDATQVADRALAAVALPFDLGPAVVSIGVSIGIAFGGPGSRVSVLLREADAAMYRAKENGRLRWELTPSAPPTT